MILDAFRKYPAEGEIIGGLLATYALIEIALMHCVQVVRGGDLDTVLKTMFRTRGETQRIDVADAFGRQHYESQGLGTEFSMGVGAVRFCLKIRNQYAHCYFYNDLSGRLAFVNLEELAAVNTKVQDLTDLTRHYVTVDLLNKQEQYFAYAVQLVDWTNFQNQLLTGGIQKNPRAKPAQLVQPDLYTP